MKSTKVICILLVLVVAASALGCIGQKKEVISTKAPTVTMNGIVESELNMNESDLAQMDSMMSEMNMDISLSEIDI